MWDGMDEGKLSSSFFRVENLFAEYHPAFILSLGSLDASRSTQSRTDTTTHAHLRSTLYSITTPDIIITSTVITNNIARHTRWSDLLIDGETAPRYQLPPSPKTAWREKTLVELSRVPTHETETEQADRLQEIDWIKGGMTQVELNVQKSYRKAERYGVGKPSRVSVDGGLPHGDEGWSVIEDGTPGRKMIDLVFIQDATGSMGSYIASATRNIETICNTIIAHEKMESEDDLRVGIVAYRDHPGQDNSYVTKTLPFTSNTTELHHFLDNLRAGGGGDGPEAVIAGMAVALGDLQWRRNAAKMIVIITDAPPHGIGERGDGFPQGEPGGWDGLVLARNMAARGISCFIVACESNLSHYDRAVEYYQAIATITSGLMLPLMSADLLTNAIIGSVLENMEMEQLIKEVGEEIYSRMAGKTDEESIDSMARELQNALSMQGRVTKKIQIANIYNETPAYLENVKTWVNAENAQVGKEHIRKFLGNRFTDEYDKYKGRHGRGYGGYSRDWAPPLPRRKKSATMSPASPPAVRKIVDGRAKFVPSGMDDDDDSDSLTSDSGSDEDGMKPKAGEISATFKPYDGGAKRLSTGGGLLSSLPTDMKSKTTFTGLRESGSKPARMVDSDADSDDDLPSKRANDTPADDGEAKPDTLAFTNDAISLEQAKRIAVQSIWRMRK